MYNILPIISKQNLEYIVVLLTGGIGYSQYVLQKNHTSTFTYILAMDPVLMYPNTWSLLITPNYDHLRPSNQFTIIIWQIRLIQKPTSIPHWWLEWGFKNRCYWKSRFNTFSITSKTCWRATLPYCSSSRYHSWYQPDCTATTTLTNKDFDIQPAWAVLTDLLEK